MNLKEYADSRKLTIRKVKTLCQVCFDSIPESLTDEQITALDHALTNAAQAALPQSDTVDDSVGKVELFGANKLQQHTAESPITERVIGIVGVKTLLKNIGLYAQFAQTAFRKSNEDTYKLAFQVEQKFYNDLALSQKKILDDSANRMQLAVNSVNSLDSVKSSFAEYVGYPASDDDEDLLVYQAALSILEGMGL